MKRGRLTEKEFQIITSVIAIADPKAQVFLFGSRADLDLKGGDIDLLVISEKLNFSEKIGLLVELKGQLGDQKIDLVLRTPAVAQSDPFCQKILQESVPLTLPLV